MCERQIEVSIRLDMQYQIKGDEDLKHKKTSYLEVRRFFTF